MDLQLALDMVSLDEALDIVDSLDGLADIVEIGTPMIFRYGLKAVETMKTRFPEQRVLADLKIIDSGRIEAEDGFKAGAEFVTAMAAANDATIANVVAAARDCGGKVMVDLLAIKDPVTRAREILALGVDVACVHTARDAQDEGGDPLSELSSVAAAVGGDRVAVAGGVNLDSLPAMAAHRPKIVIVGLALAGVAMPARRDIAEKMKGVMNNV